MVILSPENGQRKLPPVGSPEPVTTTLVQLTAEEVLRQAIAAQAKARAAAWTRAANQQALRFAGAQTPTGAAAGGAGKNTTPPQPVAIPLPPVPSPIAKVPQIPELPPLPPPPAAAPSGCGWGRWSPCCGWWHPPADWPGIAC